MYWIIGIFASLLPRRWRGNTGLVTSAEACASGVVQLLLCTGLLIYRYVLFANARYFHTPTEVTLRAAESGGETAVMGMGIFVLLEYLIQPVTLLLTYFALEGLARALAAFISSETVATLPLVALAWVHDRISAHRAERKLGERVPDMVQRPGPYGFDLMILSCRPKLEWNALMTVEYEDQLFEVGEEKPGVAPYRWVYLLRKKPQSKIVRGLYRYDPEETLVKESAQL